MIKVIMMCGICGSGKTTYAKQKKANEENKRAVSIYTFIS